MFSEILNKVIANLKPVMIVQKKTSCHSVKETGSRILKPRVRTGGKVVMHRAMLDCSLVSISRLIYVAKVMPTFL